MRTALEIAREACAQLVEADGAVHTAAGYRAGRYDEGGTMPLAIRAAEIALAENAIEPKRLRRLLQLEAKEAARSLPL